jgi:spermidine/putrescine transport system substrate-binding protein
MSPRLATYTFGLVIIIVVLWVWVARTMPKNELNALTYIGYDEQDLVDAFSKATGIRLRTKTYFGGDEMMTVLKESKGEYDLVVIDPEYLKKLVDANQLQPLSEADYNVSDYNDSFKHFKEFYIGESLYAIVVRYGVNGLVFNVDHVARPSVLSYKAIWSDDLKGRIGLIDQYLVSMGAISKALGNKHAYDLDSVAFESLERSMMALKPRLKSIYTIPEMFRALATGEIWVLPCGGESVVFNLRDSGNFDWVIPEEGGIMWVEGLAITRDARHVEAARRFISWAQSPEAQALLATRKAYASNVPNKKAYDLLSYRTKEILRSSTDEEVDSLLARLSVRSLPVNQPEAQWVGAWQRFKAQ